jgi:hypothetical protein
MTPSTANFANPLRHASSVPERNPPDAGSARCPREVRARLARCLATVLQPLKDAEAVKRAAPPSGKPPIIDLGRTDMGGGERLARLAETMLVHGVASMALPTPGPDSTAATQGQTVAQWLLSEERSARIFTYDDAGGDTLRIESRPRPRRSESGADTIELLVNFNGHRFESAMLIHGAPTRMATRRVEPSPVIRCPEDQAVRPVQTPRAVQIAPPRSVPRAAVPSAPPKPDFAALTELLGRMKAPTGVKGWWRRTFGPKAKPDEVVELARALARPAMAQWRDRCKGQDVTVLHSEFRHWCGGLLRESFDASAPRSRKRWASRVHGDGTGAFRAAWQAQGHRLYEVLHDPRSSRETIDEEVGTFMVLKALRAAAG